jgi:hypothetical protein
LTRPKTIFSELLAKAADGEYAVGRKDVRATKKPCADGRYAGLIDVKYAVRRSKS